MTNTPWLTPGEQASWHDFMQMQELLRTRLEQGLESHSSLSSAEYTVLAALSEAPEQRLRPFDLSRRLGWEKSRLHHLLTRMCNRGFVERQPATESSNSRAVEVALTREGLSAIRDAAPQHVRDVRKLALDALADDQIAQLGKISRAILRHLAAD